MRRLRAQRETYRPPFWLAASNFYFLSTAFAVGVFFLVWAILHDAREDTAIFPAGIVASVTLLSAVAVRVLIIRKIRNRIVATQKLEHNLSVLGPRAADTSRPKLTIEQNARILRELQRKSEAAKVLSKYAEGHREAYQLCAEYLSISETELRAAGPGSPRIAALRKGRQLAGELHRYHTLRWAELEVTNLTQQSKKERAAGKRIEAAERAMDVIDTASASYPGEASLVESAEFLSDYIAVLRVSDLIGRAGRARDKEKLKEAKKLYLRAREVIQSRHSHSDGLTLAAAQIDAELERIRDVTDRL